MNERTFHIVAICTGNASRSPAVERILAARLGPTVTVESAGTAAVVGQPIAAEMATLLRAEGIDTSRFTARQVTPELLRGADLVLALARENLDRVVELVPEVLHRAFTLTEFARFAAARPVDDVAAATAGQRLHALVAAAGRARAAEGARPSDPYDVPNPFRLGPAAYRQAFAMIEQATGAIVRAASPGPPPNSQRAGEVPCSESVITP